MFPISWFLPVVDRLTDELYDEAHAAKVSFCGEPFSIRIVQAFTMTFESFLLLGLLTR